MPDVVGRAELRRLMLEGERRLREAEARAVRLRLDERWRLHGVGLLAHPAFAGVLSLCVVLLGARSGLTLAWPYALAATFLLGGAVAGLGVWASERVRLRLSGRVGALPIGISGLPLLWTTLEGRTLRIEPAFDGPTPTLPTFRALLAAAGLPEVCVVDAPDGAPALLLRLDRVGSAERAVRVLEQVLAPLAAVFPVQAVRLRAVEPAPVRAPVRVTIVRRRLKRPRQLPHAAGEAR